MLSSFYDDAVAQLEAAMNVNRNLIFSSFYSALPNHAIIEGRTFEKLGSEESDRANISVYLQFREVTITDEGEYKQNVKGTHLIILNPEADNKWTKRMRLQVWDDRYPDSIAIDRDTGEVFLLFLDAWGVELRHFAKIKLSDLEALLLTLDETAPFYIFVDDDAMFMVLDGSEGWNHLLDNLYISLKGSRRLKLYIRKSAKNSENKSEEAV